jgi:hypothetical protein
MMFHRSTFLRALPLVAGGWLVPSVSYGANLKPRLTVRGKLKADLPFSDFSTDGWSKGRGHWEIKKGELSGEQVDPGPLEFARVHHKVDLGTCAIIEGEVMLDGAYSLWFDLGDGGALKHTAARLGFWEDASEISQPGVPALKSEIRKGKWVPFLVEFSGIEVAASRERVEISTEHPLFDRPRVGLGISVSSPYERGEDGPRKGLAGVRSLKVFEATPNPKWKKPRDAKA